jgi:hypothetical protein
MLLRRITEHVKTQNWTAVVIDFVIVVVGVFIGIQVSNWNEGRVARAHETELLIALRDELESTIRVTDQKRSAIAQVADAGMRSLEFLAREAPCGSECWNVLVDFLHASQWQSIDVSRSTYEEMRRQGLPRSRAVIDAVEAYLSQNASLASTMLLPAYRSRVRQLIPVEAQAYYWEHCFNLDDGAEYYVLDCPKGVADDVAARAVERIAKDPTLQPHLTEWIGLLAFTPSDLGEQNEAAQRAIDAIDAEL